MKKTLGIVAVLLAVAFGTAIAHSGGTDSSGCHKDHKTGGWHCH